MPWWTLLATLLATALCASEARAGAPPKKLQLVYEAPEACPSRGELVEQIAARVGYAPIDDEAALDVGVRVVADDRVYRASVVGAGGARRTFASSDCRELVHSVALTLAFYLDPMLGPKTPPAPAKVSVTEPWREPDPFEKEAPTPTPVQAQHASLYVSAAVGASVALLPSPSLGPRLALGWRLGSFAIGVEGRADLPTASRSVSGLGVQASFAGASLVPCVRRGWASACVEWWIGRYEATATDPSGVRSDTGVFVMPGARIGAAIPVGDRAFLTISLFGAAPLTRMRLLVSNEPVWQTGPLTGGVAIGGEWSP